MREGSRQQVSLVSDGGHIQKNLKEMVIQLREEAHLGDRCRQKLIAFDGSMEELIVARGKVVLIA